MSALLCRRIPATVLLALALTFAAAVPASAHASIDRSEPEAEAILDSAPTRVTIWFTEPLEDQFSSIRVIGPDGIPIDSNNSTVAGPDRTSLTVGLTGELSDGSYVVQWKSLSSVDGHLIRGAYVFSIGAPSELPTVDLSTSLEVPEPNALGVAIRAFQYAALAWLAGIFILRFFIFRDAGWSEARLRRLRNVTLLTAVVMISAALASLVDQASQAAGVEFLEAIPSATLIVLLQTQFGMTVIVQLAVLAVLFYLADEVLFDPSGGRRATWIRGGIGAAVVLFVGGTLAVNSHSAATARFELLVFDMVHLTSMTAWFGGLFAILLLLPRLDSGGWLTPESYARGIGRFSGLALTAIVILLVTGLYQAEALVGSLPAFLVTPYGQILLVKLGLFGFLVAFGAWNLLYLRPRLQRDSTGLRVRRWLSWSIATEATIALAVLATVGWLTSQQTSLQQFSADVGANASVEFRTVDDLSIAFAYDPSRLARARFQVTLASNGRAVDDAEEVTIVFRNLLGPPAVSEATARALGYGLYTASGTFTPLDGAWEATVTVARAGHPQAVASFPLRVGRSAELATTGEWRLPPIGLLWGVSLLLMVAAVAGLRWAPRIWSQHRNGRLALSAALFLIASATLGFQAYTPPNPSLGLINPIAPMEDSIALGRRLYDARCVSCHGIGGRGDGPQSAALAPAPSNLVTHTPSHADGELFAWITEGIPDSSMAGTNGSLSEEDRWHIVNYVRFLAAPAPER